MTIAIRNKLFIKTNSETHTAIYHYFGFYPADFIVLAQSHCAHVVVPQRPSGVLSCYGPHLSFLSL